MHKYLVATLSSRLRSGLLWALGADLGGKVGGIGIGASLGLCAKGASEGVGTSVDGLGGVNIGGSVGTKKGSLGADVGASANLGGASGSPLAGLGAGDASSGGVREEAPLRERQEADRPGVPSLRWGAAVAARRGAATAGRGSGGAGIALLARPRACENRSLVTLRPAWSPRILLSSKSSRNKRIMPL